MSRYFLRSEKSSTGFIYPDNYLGAGMPAKSIYGMDALDEAGNYERAIVVGTVEGEDRKKYAAVRLLDLCDLDGSPMYGVIPEGERFLKSVEDSDIVLTAGSLVTVELEDLSEGKFTTKRESFESTYLCSRRSVMEDVRKQLESKQEGDYILGRVSGRGKNWVYKIDVGAGYRIYMNERELGKHSVRSRSALTGSLVLLRKEKDGYKACAGTFDDCACDLLHGAQARGVLTRADGGGQNFAYIPNCGFVYLAGCVDGNGENRTISIGAEIEGKVLQLGSVLRIEIVRTKEQRICGYVREVLATDAVSGSVFL